MSKKRKKKNQIWNSLEFFFVQKTKTFAQKKSIMKFWEIQEKKSCRKKKCTKKIVMNFREIQEKSFFF